MTELKVATKAFTKKNKKPKDSKNTNHLWNLFDTECGESKQSIECIYRKNDKKTIASKTPCIKTDKDFCECCNGNLTISDEGFLSCQNPKCGIIYKDSLDNSAEWRFYGADDSQGSDPTRCGMPINPLLKESSFACKVLCSPQSSYEMRKIRRYTEWQAMPYKEKSQYDEFQRITVIAQNAGLPKMLIDDAIRYHKQISEAKTFRGLNRDGIIAASIYVSCRVNNFPRTAKEIATIFYLDNTSATKGCKNALAIINELEHSLNNNDKIVLHKTTPISFIDRYCSRLGINKELTNVCKFIAIRIEDKNLIPENTPHSIAAGIIYFVAHTCNVNINKKQVNIVSEISEVTINKCYKKLEFIMNELIPPKILEKYTK